MQNCKIMATVCFSIRNMGLKKLLTKKDFFLRYSWSFLKFFWMEEQEHTGPKNVFNNRHPHSPPTSNLNHTPAALIGGMCRETLQYHLPKCVCNRISHSWSSKLVPHLSSILALNKILSYFFLEVIEFLYQFKFQTLFHRPFACII